MCANEVIPVELFSERGFKTHAMNTWKIAYHGNRKQEEKEERQ